MSDIDRLNEQFGIGEELVITERNELACCQIQTGICSGEIFLHGAHVSRFQKAGQKPLLFMSEASHFSHEKAIRGGIPICFPWFGAHSDASLPSHGYARIQAWSLQKTDKHDDTISISFGCTIEPFKLRYDVRLGEVLDVELHVTNRANQNSRFEVALHSYFQLSDLKNVTVRGLEQVSFLDQLTNQRHDPTTQPITFGEETDRIYDSEGSVEIHDSGWDRAIVIEKRNSRSTVVWNPWIAKSQRMADFGDEEYHRMCCIETAAIEPHGFELEPDESTSIGCIHRVEVN